MLYELLCDDCHKSYDMFLRMEQMESHLQGQEVVSCPVCNEPLRRSYRNIAIVGDTCAGNQNCEGVHPDLGYVRGRSHMEQLAKERGLVETRPDEALHELRYINKHGGKNKETKEALSAAGKEAGIKRRENIVREGMKTLPDITRDDLAKTKADLAKQPQE
jgi:hypothetical protein